MSDNTNQLGESREIYPTQSDVVRAFAERLVEVAREAILARGRFIFALSGGSTPKELFALLASDEFREQFDWSKIVIVWGDDRAVGPDDELSNYRMAKLALLDKVPVLPENVHRMRGEAEDLEEAAKEYGLLMQELGALDVALMGMGPDGHTASLFPHSPQLNETKHRCVATPIASHEPHVRRLTLTYRMFNDSRHLWMLVCGASKAQRTAQVLAGPIVPQELPVQGLRGSESNDYVWWMDEAAASALN